MEQNESSEVTSDEVVTDSDSDESKKARYERHNARLAKELSEAKKRLQELEGIEESAAKQSGDLSKQFELKDRKIEELNSKISELVKEKESKEMEIATRDFMSSVLEGVSTSHLSTARDLLELRIIKGEYDPTEKRDMKRAQKELAEKHRHLFEEGPIPSTRTVSVSGNMDENSFSSWGEVPTEDRAEFMRKFPHKARELLRKQYS